MTRRKSWEGVGEPLFGEDWWVADQRLFEDSVARKASRSHLAVAHWARARSWRPVRSADEVRVPATTNAVSSGSRPKATGSDAHSDRRPMTGGPQTNPAHPQADAVATAVPGARPGIRPAALNTAGTMEARPMPRQQNPRRAAGGSAMSRAAANPAVATTASAGSSRSGRKRVSSRLPDSRMVTMASANVA